jgi:hypothetical protein
VSHAVEEPVAVLWTLVWDENRLCCAVYRRGTGLELRVESARAVIVCEAFTIEPRALARAHMLRDDLKRRGWSENTAAHRTAEPDTSPL